MKIKDYLEAKNLTNAQFGERFGLSDVRVSHLINGYRLPSLKLCKKIIEASDGEITLEDLRPEVKEINELDLSSGE